MWHRRYESGGYSSKNLPVEGEYLLVITQEK